MGADTTIPLDIAGVISVIESMRQRFRGLVTFFLIRIAIASCTVTAYRTPIIPKTHE